MEWRSSSTVGKPMVGTCPQQQLHGLEVSVRSGQVERRGALHIAHREISARKFEEKPQMGQPIARLGRGKQRHPHIECRAWPRSPDFVGVGTGLKQFAEAMRGL